MTVAKSSKVKIKPTADQQVLKKDGTPIILHATLFWPVSNPAEHPPKVFAYPQKEEAQLKYDFLKKNGLKAEMKSYKLVEVS